MNERPCEDECDDDALLPSVKKAKLEGKNSSKRMVDMIHKRAFFHWQTCITHTLLLLLIGTYRPAVAHEVIKENISLIKSTGIGLVLLANKLLEKKIINERQKKEVTDSFTGRTEDERMNALLSILISAIKVEGKVFGIFLEILKEEDTLVSISLADKLLADYKAK